MERSQQALSEGTWGPQSRVDSLVIESFPFPLAMTYARLTSACQREDPLMALVTAREAFECFIKYSACLAVGAFLNEEPDPRALSRIVGLLFKPTRLSIGDWHSLICEAARPHPASATSDPQPLITSIQKAFYRSGKKVAPSELNLLINGGPHNFVQWRNETFGHGVLSREPEWQKNEAIRWKAALERYYAAESVRELLLEWVLAESPDGRSERTWRGTQNTSETHQHRMSGPPTPLCVVRGTRRIRLAPMLAVQTCARCGQPAVFFFDHYRPNGELAHFLEYECGQTMREFRWEALERLRRYAPPRFVFQRTATSVAALRAEEDLVFRDEQSDYIAPVYLLERIWQEVFQRECGYIFLWGRSGVGKTWLLRGLDREPHEDCGVLVFHILSRARTNYQTFVSELKAKAASRFLKSVAEIQLRNADSESLAEDLCDFMAVLRESCGLRKLLLAIDGLDELVDTDPAIPSIADFLPQPDALPDGCFILLTSRPELRPRTKARVDGLRSDEPNIWRELWIEENSGPNNALIGAFAARLLAGHSPSKATLDEIVRKAGGVFLYARHLCEGLRLGLFDSIDEFPVQERFYAAYLDAIRKRCGTTAFETVYKKLLLLLAAAQRPVTLDLLAQWGLQRSAAEFAVLDLRDFLRVTKRLPWADRYEDAYPDDNFYELGHESLIRYFHSDASLVEEVRQVHSSIATVALTQWRGKWHETAITEDHAYLLRFLPKHMIETGSNVDRSVLFGDETYGIACKQAAYHSRDRDHFNLVIPFAQTAVEVFEGKTAEQPTEASHKIELAAALHELGIGHEISEDYTAANECYSRSVTLWRDIVSHNPCPQTLTGLADALNGYGVGLRCADQPADAEVFAREACTVYDRLIQGEDTSDVRIALARAARNLAISIESQDRLDEALALYDRAVALLRPISSNIRAQEQLTWCLNSRGWGLFLAKRYGDAVGCYQEAERLLDELIERDSPYHRFVLARVCHNLGTALAASGELGDGIAAVDRAARLREALVFEEGCEFIVGDWLASVTKALELLCEARRPAELTNRGSAVLGRLNQLRRQGRNKDAETTSHVDPVDAAIHAGAEPDSFLSQRLTVMAYIAAGLFSQKRFLEAAQKYRQMITVLESSRAVTRLPREYALASFRALVAFSLSNANQHTAAYEVAYQVLRANMNLLAAPDVAAARSVAQAHYCASIALWRSGRNLSEAVAALEQSVSSIQEFTSVAGVPLSNDFKTHLWLAAYVSFIAGRQDVYGRLLNAHGDTLRAFVEENAQLRTFFSVTELADVIHKVAKHDEVDRTVLAAGPRFQEAVTIIERLVGGMPPPIPIGLISSAIASLRSSALRKAGYLSEALRAVRLARQLLRTEYAVLPPQILAFFVELSETDSELCWALRDWKGKAEVCQSAIDILEPGYMLEGTRGLTVGQFYRHLGWAVGAGGEHSKAIPSYRRAVEILRACHTACPTGDSQYKLHSAYNSLGVGLQEAGCLGEALDEYRKAVDMADACPDGPECVDCQIEAARYCANQVEVLGKLGDSDSILIADATRQRLTRIKSGDSNVEWLRVFAQLECAVADIAKASGDLRTAYSRRQSELEYRRRVFSRQADSSRARELADVLDQCAELSNTLGDRDTAITSVQEADALRHHYGISL